MKKLVEIRNQEFICASLDSERRIFRLRKAEEWEQCALDEVAFHFGERNLVVPIPKQAPTTSTRANEALSLR